MAAVGFLILIVVVVAVWLKRRKRLREADSKYAIAGQDAAGSTEGYVAYGSLPPSESY